MDLDADHQKLKADLLEAFERASEPIEQASRKTQAMRSAIDEDQDNEGDSKLLKLRKINGATEVKDGR